jgi:hypothetical protein
MTVSIDTKSVYTAPIKKASAKKAASLKGKP